MTTENQPEKLQPAVLLRRAQACDAQALCSIANETAAQHLGTVVVEPWTTEIMAADIECFRANSWPLVVVLLNGKAVGYAGARNLGWAGSACAMAAEISLFVTRDWHGRGIAPVLLAGIYSEVRRAGYHTVTTWITDMNAASSAIARSLGLALWGNLPGVVRVFGRAMSLTVYGAALDDENFIRSMFRLRRISARVVARLEQSLRQEDGTPG